MAGKMYDGRWERLSDLPGGGQAHTYLVRDATKPEEDTKYVLKRLKNLKRIGRMRNEVEAGLKLEHQNVVRVIAWNLETAEPYIVTDYYSGGSLEDATPFEFGYGHLFDLMGQICDGVLHAHSRGVKHRDLKPDNIFLSADREGHAVVGDFGLCLIDEGERVTLSEEAVGGRYYMAPELEDGRTDQVSETSDVYSLGKLLYWLMSSGKVFSREKHREEAFDLVRITMNPYLEHVNRLLDHMVAAEPAARWPLAIVRKEIVLRKRLVVGEYNPVGPTAWAARCTYCGIGSYFDIGPGPQALVRDAFIREGQPGEWRILVCSYCAHIQMFRPDIGSRISPSHSTPWDTPVKDLPPPTSSY